MHRTCFCVSKGIHACKEQVYLILTAGTGAGLAGNTESFNFAGQNAVRHHFTLPPIVCLYYHAVRARLPHPCSHVHTELMLVVQEKVPQLIAHCYTLQRRPHDRGHTMRSDKAGAIQAHKQHLTLMPVFSKPSMLNDSGSPTLSHIAIYMTTLPRLLWHMCPCSSPSPTKNKPFSTPSSLCNPAAVPYYQQARMHQDPAGTARVQSLRTHTECSHAYILHACDSMQPLCRHTLSVRYTPTHPSTPPSHPHPSHEGA
jgi:hypothetical protein